jgi:hypothetical protein
MTCRFVPVRDRHGIVCLLAARPRASTHGWRRHAVIPETQEIQEIQKNRAWLAEIVGEDNHRLVALLELVMKDPLATFTAQSHATSHDVPGRTARQDLPDREARGLQLRQERGRKYPGKATSDLPRRITGVIRSRRVF